MTHQNIDRYSTALRCRASDQSLSHPVLIFATFDAQAGARSENAVTKDARASQPRRGGRPAAHGRPRPSRRGRPGPQSTALGGEGRDKTPGSALADPRDLRRHQRSRPTVGPCAVLSRRPRRSSDRDAGRRWPANRRSRSLVPADPVAEFGSPCRTCSTTPLRPGRIGARLRHQRRLRVLHGSETKIAPHARCARGGLAVDQPLRTGGRTVPGSSGAIRGRGWRASSSGKHLATRWSAGTCPSSRPQRCRRPSSGTRDRRAATARPTANRRPRHRSSG
jgi:hypothetical protein